MKNLFIYCCFAVFVFSSCEEDATAIMSSPGSNSTTSVEGVLEGINIGLDVQELDIDQNQIAILEQRIQEHLVDEGFENITAIDEVEHTEMAEAFYEEEVEVTTRPADCPHCSEKLPARVTFVKSVVEMTCQPQYEVVVCCDGPGARTYLVLVQPEC